MYNVLYNMAGSPWGVTPWLYGRESRHNITVQADRIESSRVNVINTWSEQGQHGPDVTPSVQVYGVWCTFEVCCTTYRLYVPGQAVITCVTRSTPQVHTQTLWLCSAPFKFVCICENGRLVNTLRLREIDSIDRLIPAPEINSVRDRFFIKEILGWHMHIIRWVGM
jgi:hypothetical protein